MEVVENASRFEVWLVRLDPTMGSEIKKTRPGGVVSPNEMNQHLNTVIVAPMTTAKKTYPTRVPLTFGKKSGYVVLDQIRTVDKVRLVKKLGKVSPVVQKRVLELLTEMFAE